MPSIPINSGTGPYIAVDVVGTDNFQIVKIMQSDSGTTGGTSVLSVTATGYNVIGVGRATVAANGVAISIATTSITCAAVKLVGLSSQTSTLFYGGATVIASSGSQTGIILYADQATDWIPINNVNKIYINAASSGHGVSYAYLV